MSIRKQHKRKLHPILNIVKSALQLGPRDVALEEQISRGIAEEIMRTDAISKIQSISTLRYIIYQLILYSCQQKVKGGGTQDAKCQLSSKSKEMLGDMKAMLADIMRQSEQYALKSMGFENEKYPTRQNQINKNKLRVFSNYFNQYYSLTQDKLPKTTKKQTSTKDNEKQQALIDQLQALVIKKQQQLKQSINEKKLLQDEINELIQQISTYRIQSSQFSSQNIKIKIQNQKLKNQLQICTQKMEQKIQQCQTLKEINFKSIDKVIVQQSPQSLLFSNDVSQYEPEYYPKEQEYYQSQPSDNEYLKLLISQAMTIQAIIK